MSEEEVKEKIKYILLNDPRIDSDEFSVITNVMLSISADIDIRAYIDSEMQKQLYSRPYCFQYVISKSTQEKLVFLNTAPQLKEYGDKKVDIVWRYFDYDENQVKEYLVSKLHFWI